MKLFTYGVALTLLINLSAYSQDKIEGIGKFKIGKSNLSLIEDLAAESNSKVKLIETFNDYYNAESASRSQIGRVAPNTNVPHSSGCEGVEVYYLNKYTVADIPITDIFLTFKDGLLVDFTSKANKELTDALTLKYGKGELKADTKVVSCIYKLTGAKTQEEENSYYTTWNNENIVAQHVLLVYFDDNCKKKYINSFNIGYPDQMRDIQACNRAILLKANASKEEEKKKKLADF